MRNRLLLLALLALATRAPASDVLVQIDQACAVEKGCLAGGAAAFRW